MEEQTKTVTELLHEQHELIRALFDQVERTTGAEKVETFDNLRALLAVHETAEEELVHPAAKKMGGDAADAVQRRLQEESDAKRMLADLEKAGPGGGGFDELFATFRAAVLDHAEAEEAEVFPFLDGGMDADRLRMMADALLEAERMAPTHPHPHGPESATGNMLVGPFVSMVDRVRDAIKNRRAA